MIEEKILERMIEKKRFDYILKDDLFNLIKEKYEPELRKWKTSKSDLIELVKKYFNEETLSDFAKVPRFGLAKCDIREILNIGKSTVNKLIESGRIKPVGEIVNTRGRFKIIYDVYSVSDIVILYYEDNLK